MCGVVYCEVRMLLWRVPEELEHVVILLQLRHDEVDVERSRRHNVDDVDRK